jgi:hypothetical protein
MQVIRLVPLFVLKYVLFVRKEQEMSKRLMLFFLVCMLAVLLAADGVLCAAKVDRSRDAGYKKYLGNELRIRGDEEILSSPMSKYPAYGSKGPVVTCDDIEPEMGPEYLIDHQPLGHTWYDFQKNGSMGRMISVTSDGYKHISWMFCNGVYSTAYPRWVDANQYHPGVAAWTGQVHVYGGQYKNAGYSNQDHLSTGISTVIYHRTARDPYGTFRTRYSILRPGRTGCGPRKPSNTMRLPPRITSTWS